MSKRPAQVDLFSLITWLSCVAFLALFWLLVVLTATVSEIQKLNT